MELRRGKHLPNPAPPAVTHGTRVVAVHRDGRISVERLLVDTTDNRRCGGMSGIGWELYLSRAGFARHPQADPDAADPAVVRVLVLGPVVAAPEAGRAAGGGLAIRGASGRGAARRGAARV